MPISVSGFAGITGGGFAGAPCAAGVAPGCGLGGINVTSKFLIKCKNNSRK
jgi:hypothetical protein